MSSDLGVKRFGNGSGGEDVASGGGAGACSRFKIDDADLAVGLSLFRALQSSLEKQRKKSLLRQSRSEAARSASCRRFVPVATLEEAKRRSAPARPAVDVEFINPFIMATKKVIETQAQTPLAPGKAYLRKPSERIPMEIAGVIGLSCTEFKGSISICFRAEVFLKIYENMVGEKHDQITGEIEDAAGELLNIIFGQAKTVLNDQKGYTLEKALPTILVGEKLKLHHQSRAPAIVLPFESPAGAFHLEILIDRT
jgi:chemotaxis protein CheX